MAPVLPPFIDVPFREWPVRWQVYYTRVHYHLQEQRDARRLINVRMMSQQAASQRYMEVHTDDGLAD